MKSILQISIITIISLVFFCCKDDDQPADPCANEIETSAEFGFFSRFFIHSKPLVKDSICWIPLTDTIYNSESGGGTPIYFKAANSNMETYEWTVGLDSRVFTDSVFQLAFEGINGDLDVRLEVTNDILEGCLPDIPRTMEQTQTVYMKSYFTVDELLILEKSFVGYDDDQPDSLYTISFRQFSQGLTGFPRNCTILSNSGIRFVSGGRRFVIDKYASTPYPTNNCGRVSGSGELQEDGKTLIFDYSLEFTDGREKINRRFIGTKI